MKRLIFALLLLLALPVGAVADVDLSSMSFDELVALRDQLNLAIWNSVEWQEVTVPQGIWEVGKDIPAGHWSLSPMEKSSAAISYGDTLEENGKEVSYRSDNYFYQYLKAPGATLYDENSDVVRTDVVAESGSYIEIEYGSVRFTPYSGRPDLGFGGSPVSYATKPTPTPSPTPAPTSVPLVDGKYEFFNFNKAARMPDDYKNTNVYLNGEVVQVLGSRKEGYTLRVSTSGSYDDVILVYIRSSAAPSYNILDEDQLYIKGYSGGEYTYESTVGTEITVPLVYADYVEILGLK